MVKGRDPDQSRPADYEGFDPLTTMGATSAHVLVIGRSAGERESVARAVHRHQRGHDGTFLRLNCGRDDLLLRQALQDWLTWAEGDEPPSLLARLDGGSLFLDDIENLGSPTQKLLLEFMKLERPANPDRPGVLRPGQAWRGQLIAGCVQPLRHAIQDSGFLAELADCLDKVRIVLDPDDPAPRS